MGFGIPIDLWFRAELRPMLEDLLLDHPRTGELYLPGGDSFDSRRALE